MKSDPDNVTKHRKVRGINRETRTLLAATHTPPGEEQAPNPTYCARGTWKPRIALPLSLWDRDSGPRGLLMAVRANGGRVQ